MWRWRSSTGCRAGWSTASDLALYGLAAAGIGYLIADEGVLNTLNDTVVIAEATLSATAVASIMTLAAGRPLVVRVADEIVVDLMKRACGVEYAEAERMVDAVTIDGVSIPFANIHLLWKTKQAMREKDAVDRTFLAARLARRPG